MEIYKEYKENGENAACVIRTNTYASSVQHFLNLLEEAQKDFPNVTASDLEVHHFAGRSYRRTFGVFFRVKMSEVPKAYRKIKEIEETF